MPTVAVLKRPSASRVSWLLLQDEADLEPPEQRLRESLQARCPELQQAMELAQWFGRMIRERREEDWEGWLARASLPTAVGEIKSFAAGLKKDEEAVRAALRLP
jgi:transposase